MPGRAIIAVRDNEIAAESLGINTTKYKVIAFVLGALFAAMAGSLRASFIQSIAPKDYAFMQNRKQLITSILKASENELIGLIGPNGAGKTTLFNLLTGVYRPTEGDVALFDGQKLAIVNQQSPAKRARLGIARTFQNIRLFESRTVLENVMIAMNSHTRAHTWDAILRLPSFYKHEATLKNEARQLLSIFDMLGVQDTLATNLPYGQQRRLEIVRALATKPKILFLDEPAAGMNPQETADLTRLIKQVQQEFKMTIILIEHDMNLVMAVSERLYVLEYGKLLASGTPAEIQQNADVIRAYLGENDNMSALLTVENLNVSYGAIKAVQNVNFTVHDNEIVSGVYQDAATLSGGEQQMLAMGRALMAKPKLLLLDEPSMGLAPLFIEKIFDIIKTVNEQGVTVLVIEQNANQALKIADRGYVLESGQITMTGTGAELLASDDVRKAYLGG
ncbi:hypothetical protein Pfo_031518 [Paulownia fortunei]|nr:hypothetical protein Pfo_031518 [Paulownia fortunei]